MKALLKPCQWWWIKQHKQSRIFKDSVKRILSKEVFEWCSISPYVDEGYVISTDAVVLSINRFRLVDVTNLSEEAIEKIKSCYKEVEV